MLEINDIKPLVTIPDYSMYLYYGLIFIAISIGCLMGYFVYKYFTTNKISLDKQYYQKLQDIDLSNTKQSAYAITHYGILLTKTQRQKDIFEELNHLLEEFKYKKNVPSTMPTDIQDKYNIFLESIDV